MSKLGNYSAYIVSAVVHLIVLGVMAAIQLNLIQENPDILLETVFSEERDQQEFTQELEETTEAADSINVIPGGVISTAVGATAAPSVSQTKIETSESLKEPEVRVNVGEFTLPGDAMLGEDLGEAEVTGETGAVVDGYGAAMGRMTMEILRMMRESRVLVVWLFDESESMKDDQKEIAGNFQKIYEELGIASTQDKNLRRNDDILLTAVHSYGKDLHDITPKPTADTKEVKEAINKIQIDESGLENTCQSIMAVLEKYRTMAARNDRKLVVIVVSDESGSDGQYVEEVIHRSQRARAPIYFMGREAVFGYPYARIRWVDPVYNLTHWLTIDRGPETGFPECLQFDGLGPRYDAFSSGFGPYEQVRIARETGGIFFLLPGEEEDLTGPGAHEARRYRDLEMKEYRPLLLPRQEYEKERNASKFRRTIWEVIVVLNPHLDKELNVREWHYPTDPVEFAKVGRENFQKAVRAMQLLNKANVTLNSIEPLREKEASPRWRAAFDLMKAQILAYRVRLFQYLVALDNHQKNKPQVTKKESNEWNLRRVPKMLEPDEAQVKASKVDTAELKKQEDEARKLFQFVMKEHPGTPWAARAKWESDRGFGMEFVENFHNPNYTKISKLPKY